MKRVTFIILLAAALNIGVAWTLALRYPPALTAGPAPGGEGLYEDPAVTTRWWARIDRQPYRVQLVMDPIRIDETREPAAFTGEVVEAYTTRTKFRSVLFEDYRRRQSAALMLEQMQDRLDPMMTSHLRAMAQGTPPPSPSNRTAVATVWAPPGADMLANVIDAAGPVPRLHDAIPRWGRPHDDLAALPHVRTAYGWPMQTVWYDITMDEPMRLVTAISGGWDRPEMIAFIGTGGILPHRPIWTGFIVNTLLYAAVLWLMLGGALFVRRAIRRRRGRCPKCAYPVGASTVCTECGARVTSSAAAVVPPPPHS